MPFSPPPEIGVDVFEDIEGADLYFEAHIYASTWTDSTEDEKWQALISATRVLDRLEYEGEIADENQALSWPRAGVYDKEGRLIDSDEFPPALKRATAELALVFRQRNYDADNTKAGVRRVKAGSVEVEFIDSGAPGKSLPDAVYEEIKQFLGTRGSSPFTVRTVRT